MQLQGPRHPRCGQGWQSEVRNDTSFPHARYVHLHYRTSQAPVAFSANPIEYRQNALAGAYHWQRASHLFHKELNSPLGIGLYNMDPILTASMHLARQSFLLDDGGLEFPKSFR
jgi:hypothetical protein